MSASREDCVEAFIYLILTPSGPFPAGEVPVDMPRITGSIPTNTVRPHLPNKMTIKMCSASETCGLLNHCKQNMKRLPGSVVGL